MKTTNLKLNDNGNELSFEVEPMDAFAAEEWLMRAGMLIGRNLMNLDGANGVEKLLSALTKVEYEKAKPLLDELLGCCSLIEGNMKTRITADSCRGRINNPMTILRLRIEAGRLNFGFLFDGAPLNSLTAEGSTSPAEK